MRLPILLSTAIALGALSAPASAQEDPQQQAAKRGPQVGEILDVRGTLDTDGQGNLVIKAKDGTWVLSDLSASRTVEALRGRTILVEGEVASRPRVEPDGSETRDLSSVRLRRPRFETARGVVDAKAGACLTTSAGRTLTLSGAPRRLLDRLKGRRVVLRGWHLEPNKSKDELVVVSAEARVTRDGYLSQRRRGADGKWEYKTTADVTVGEPVRVIDVAAYNSKTKTWRSVEQMQPGDLLFVEAELGRPRPGEMPLTGWIPAYKLSFGEKVAALPAPEVQTTPEQKTPEQADAANATAAKTGEAAARAATTAAAAKAGAKAAKAGAQAARAGAKAVGAADKLRNRNAASGVSAYLERMKANINRWIAELKERYEALRADAAEANAKQDEQQTTK